MLDTWLEEKLRERKAKGLLRSLPKPNNLIDFTSNDYLGLARNGALHQNISDTIEALALNGSTGSRLLSGNSELAERTEQFLSTIFQSHSTLLFNSGYSANLAVLSSLPQKDDTIIYDELAHASIKDGARLSLAKKFSFRHNDMDDLERKARNAHGRIFVAVESVYSMDGDECPLAELVALAERHNFILILDEAHTTGLRGPNGSGMAVHTGLHDRVDVRIYTFGKAMGVCGACVAGSNDLINYLVNFARPFIYTTAPSPYQVASIRCAFEFLGAHIELQSVLKQKIDLFRQNLGAIENRIESTSAIQTFIVPGNSTIRETAAYVQKRGFDVRPILSPTVPAGTERLRICLHTYNDDQAITDLVTCLKQIPTPALK